MRPTACDTEPLTGAATAVPRLAIMSLPWWKPVSDRAKPQSFMKRAPGTGQRAEGHHAEEERGAADAAQSRAVGRVDVETSGGSPPAWRPNLEDHSSHFNPGSHTSHETPGRIPTTSRRSGGEEPPDGPKR